MSAALTALGGLANLSAHLRREATEQQEVLDKVAAVPAVATLITPRAQHMYSDGSAQGATATHAGPAGILQLPTVAESKEGAFFGAAEVQRQEESKDEALALLEMQLSVRDEDFMAFSKAMEGLSALTTRLARDASLSTVDMA